MFQTFINYFYAYPKYTLTLSLTFLGCAIIIALICLFFKKSKSNISNERNDICLNCNNLPKNDDKAPLNEEIATVISQENDCEQTNECTESQNSSEDCKTEEAYNFENTISEPFDANESATWLIYENNGKFFSILTTSKGTQLLKTEDYPSLSGVKSGIITIKNNIEIDNYALDLNSENKFYFKVFSTAKRLLCVSDGFTTRQDCERIFFAVKQLSKNAEITLA